MGGLSSGCRVRCYPCALLCVLALATVAASALWIPRAWRCATTAVFRNTKCPLNIAARGKTSIDWFFGFKLHLVVNDKGELQGLRFDSGQHWRPYSGYQTAATVIWQSVCGQRLRLSEVGEAVGRRALGCNWSPNSNAIWKIVWCPWQTACYCASVPSSKASSISWKTFLRLSIRVTALPSIAWSISCADWLLIATNPRNPRLPSNTNCCPVLNPNSR